MKNMNASNDFGTVIKDRTKNVDTEMSLSGGNAKLNGSIELSSGYLPGLRINYSKTENGKNGAAFVKTASDAGVYGTSIEDVSDFVSTVLNLYKGEAKINNNVLLHPNNIFTKIPDIVRMGNIDQAITQIPIASFNNILNNKKMMYMYTYGSCDCYTDETEPYIYDIAGGGYGLYVFFGYGGSYNENDANGINERPADYFLVQAIVLDFLTYTYDGGQTYGYKYTRFNLGSSGSTARFSIVSVNETATVSSECNIKISKGNWAVWRVYSVL